MIVQRRPDIERFLAGPGPQVRAAVLHGRDQGVVRERAQTLAAAIAERPDDPFDVAVLSEADLAADDGRLEGELMALSMLGGRRLVRLRLTGEKPALERLAADALANHLKDRFNPEAFFLVEAAALGRDSALRKAGEAASGCGVIPCYDDEPADLARLAREALAADKLALNAEALDTFIARLPHERGVARREIERLILFLGPGRNATASLADLEGFFGVEPEASLSEAAFDAFGGRPAAAHAGLRRAGQEGESGVGAVRAMGMHLARLRRVTVLHRAGESLQTAAKASGVFWKQEREFLRQVQAWSLGELDRAQSDILAADRGCKQAGSADALLAERLALSIAGRARRLGL
ncbi:MAG TPA: DNA polymerase III subunit delta [Caulobacteraceae bacterium]|nr:DNA polymerase III subunit delta [Caulobacteraceae bacterium]